MPNRRRERVVTLVAVALLTVGCGLTGLKAESSAWAINDSSNGYVIRTSGTDSWELPPGAGGFVVSGRALTLEVLDAESCIVVATHALASDVLVDIDRQGRVDFLTQHDEPRMDELGRTTTCQRAPESSDSTTS